MSVRAHAIGYMNPGPFLPGDHQPHQGPECECGTTEAQCAYRDPFHCCTNCGHVFNGSPLYGLRFT